MPPVIADNFQTSKKTTITFVAVFCVRRFPFKKTDPFFFPLELHKKSVGVINLVGNQWLYSYLLAVCGCCCCVERFALALGWSLVTITPARSSAFDFCCPTRPKRGSSGRGKQQSAAAGDGWLSSIQLVQPEMNLNALEWNTFSVALLLQDTIATCGSGGDFDARRCNQNIPLKKDFVWTTAEAIVASTRPASSKRAFEW